MNVAIRTLGWQRAPEGLEWKAPKGYNLFLCKADNGIMCTMFDYAGDGVIEDGNYELPDSDWSLDSERWDDENVEGFPR